MAPTIKLAVAFEQTVRRLPAGRQVQWRAVRRICSLSIRVSCIESDSGKAHLKVSEDAWRRLLAILRRRFLQRFSGRLNRAQAPVQFGTGQVDRQLACQCPSAQSDQ